MLQELARDRLPDVSRAEDQRVLQIPGASSGHGTCCGSRRDDKDDRGRPEDDQLRRGRIRDARQVTRERGGSRADRHHVEDGGELVGCGVIGAFLVLVVEPVGLRHQDPERQGKDEAGDLADLADGSAARAYSHHPLGKQEGGGQADHVGKCERSAQHPATAVGLPRRERRRRAAHRRCGGDRHSTSPELHRPRLAVSIPPIWWDANADSLL